ncbi:transposase [Streptomyces sp. NPDC001279]|uniref:transposase n=1 Tax=Streptomyces sp. NPDC001279 TaxID=3364556 RepID=UPI0036B2F3D0
MGSKYTKRYSDDYKRDAIELVGSSGRTVTDVARELGINSESLHGWVKKVGARGLSIVLHHQDATAAAQRHMHGAVARIEATGLKTEAQSFAYAQMLRTTPYVVAVAGDRRQALGSADAIVARVGAES